MTKRRWDDLAAGAGAAVWGNGDGVYRVAGGISVQAHVRGAQLDFILLRITVSGVARIQLPRDRDYIALIMQQQPCESALSTKALIRCLGAPAEDEKMSTHDFAVMVGEVAAAFGACGLVHLIF